MTRNVGIMIFVICSILFIFAAGIYAMMADCTHDPSQVGRGMATLIIGVMATLFLME